MPDQIQVPVNGGDTPEHCLQHILLHHFIDAYESGINLDIEFEAVSKELLHIKKQWKAFSFNKEAFLNVSQLVEKRVAARAAMVGYPVDEALQQLQYFINRLQQTQMLAPNDKSH